MEIDARRQHVIDLIAVLPEAVGEVGGEEEQHVGFTVRKKRFAWFLDDHHGDGVVALTCKAPLGVNTDLAAAEPDRFFVPSYNGKKGWLGVRLDVDVVDWDEAVEPGTECGECSEMAGAVGNIGLSFIHADSMLTVSISGRDTRRRGAVMARSTRSQLATYERRYRELAEQVAEIGFISSGTVTRRYTTCSSAGCRCHADPPQRHGPYYQWTTKTAGKTRTRRLTPTEAKLYTEWIANDRRLRKVIQQMRQIATKAAELELTQATASDAPKV